MSKIRDGLYGLIVADALGVPAESRTREDLRVNPITGMVDGGLHGQPAGYWSDDSSMTLCLADSIGKVGYYQAHDPRRGSVPANLKTICGISYKIYTRQDTISCVVLPH